MISQTQAADIGSFLKMLPEGAAITSLVVLVGLFLWFLLKTSAVQRESAKESQKQFQAVVLPIPNCILQTQARQCAAAS